MYRLISEWCIISRKEISKKFIIVAHVTFCLFVCCWLVRYSWTWTNIEEFFVVNVAALFDDVDDDGDEKINTNVVNALQLTSNSCGSCDLFSIQFKPHQERQRPTATTITTLTKIQKSRQTIKLNPITHTKLRFTNAQFFRVTCCCCWGYSFLFWMNELKNCSCVPHWLWARNISVISGVKKFKCNDIWRVNKLSHDERHKSDMYVRVFGRARVHKPISLGWTKWQCNEKKLALK